MPNLNFDDLYNIADALALGFEELSKQIEQQREIEQRLRLRLEQTLEKYKTSSSTDPSSVEISDWRDEIVKQISPPKDFHALHPAERSTANVEKARQAATRLSAVKMPSIEEVRRCPISHKVADQEDFEHDFTTQGKPGDLHCPFAQTQGQEPWCGFDPIAAEFHGDKDSSRSQNAGESRCPIRFLDKHSPEEVAQYFENHKHEIPRSHEICVKRYQANENSIRQLDAKYGNLVSMIQGLGTKHKQYLREDEAQGSSQDKSSNKAVEKWAETIDHDSDSVEEDRVPRFEQTLRDVRVGESPSRPWGISVPIDHSLPASALPSVRTAEKPAKSSLLVESNKPEPGMSKGGLRMEETSAEAVVQSSPPQIVFNGPVFFGYSAEQAAVFLQNLQRSS